MKNLITFLLMMLLLTPCIAQQDIKPASQNDVTYKDGIAYFEGIPFTGLLYEPKTKKPIGEFRNGRRHGHFTEYHNNGRIKSEGRFNYGVKEGQHFENYENGNKKFAGNYISGKRSGKFYDFFESGNQKEVANYTEDVLNGELITYQSNGKIYTSTNYRLGKKSGVHSEWHTNGQLKREISYYDDKVSSKVIVEYDDKGNNYCELRSQNGVIVSESFFDSQKHVGYYDYANGKKKEEGVLLNGQKEGQWIEWHSNGQKSFEGSYKNGKKVGKALEFNPNGDIICDINYTEGKVHGKGIVSIGPTSYAGEWNMGNKNGEFILTDPDKSRAEGQFVNDVKEGLWIQFHSNGNKKSEATYSNGNQFNGNYNEWYSNGQKKEEKKIISSIIHGEHIKWHSNGQIETLIKYNNGKVINGQYFVYDASGNALSESNYEAGLLRSIYLYKNKLKNGEFLECYPNGSKRITGYYNNGRRVVQQRYGINRTVNQIVKGIGAVTVIAGVVFLSLAAGAI